MGALGGSEGKGGAGGESPPPMKVSPLAFGLVWYGMKSRKRFVDIGARCANMVSASSILSNLSKLLSKSAALQRRLAASYK